MTQQDYLNIKYDPDLRGTQVFAGVSDYFTAGDDRGDNTNNVQDTLRNLVPNRPASGFQVFLNARNAMTESGRTFDGPLADAPCSTPPTPVRVVASSCTTPAC